MLLEGEADQEASQDLHAHGHPPLMGLQGTVHETMLRVKRLRRAPNCASKG